MGRVWTAIRAFFGSLFNGETSERVRLALDVATSVPEIVQQRLPEPAVKPVAVAPKPVVNEALILLGSLQREARLIDFLQEDLSNYSDEQVGATAREIHRDASAVFQRFFAIQPVLTETEGTKIEVPMGFDANRFRLTGKLSGDAPYHGVLRHAGWEATRCELPTFLGSESAARVFAPAEIEIQS